jgi:organic hydroperoxide reductase OsmC/OhrA
LKWVIPPILCKKVDGVWTPEELFVVFIESRIMITFILLAQRNQIEILSYQSHTENRMINDNGIPHFVNIYIYPEITVKKETDISYLNDILNQAEKLCLSSIAVSINASTFFSGLSQLSFWSQFLQFI